MDDVTIKPQIEAPEEMGMMQIDLEPFNDEKESNLEENEVKEELDLVGANLEPYEGMEFESEEAARVFYGVYARIAGFRIRISRYTRSRRDNSVISRLIVCSKEGFRESRVNNDGVFGERKQMRQRAETRVGCKAMLMVKKLAPEKWVVSKFVKEHNHGPVAPRKVEVMPVQKEEELMEVMPVQKEEELVEESNLNVLSDGGEVNEPFEGREFDSEEDARTFYINYARQMGFHARISKYCRSRRDNSIISRQIVCSKEGFREVRVKKEENDDGRVKRPRVITRIGCKAMIIVKKLNTGKWVVSRFEKEHNHALGGLKKETRILESSNDSSEKGLVAYMGGEDVHSNAGMLTSSGCCDGSHGTSRESLTVLYNKLCREAIKYAQEGTVSEEIYNVAMSALKEAVEKVSAAKRSAGFVVKRVNAGYGCNFTKCSNDDKKAVSGSELMLLQQPVKFVLIPSGSLTNDSNLANHSVESSMMLNIPSGQGINIPSSISVLKQSPPTAPSVKGSGGDDGTDISAAQNSQLWSSSQLSACNPTLMQVVLVGGDKPFGCRFNVPQSWDTGPDRSIMFYRNELDLLDAAHVQWCPYAEDMLQLLPEICTAGSLIWRARTPMICFDVVQMHVHDRVLRQFGLAQHIPVAVERISNASTRGRAEDWSLRRLPYIQRWNERANQVFQEVLPHTDLLDYELWYWRITRRWILIECHPLATYAPRGPVERDMAHCIHTARDVIVAFTQSQLDMPPTFAAVFDQLYSLFTDTLAHSQAPTQAPAQAQEQEQLEAQPEVQAQEQEQPEAHAQEQE